MSAETTDAESPVEDVIDRAVDWDPGEQVTLRRLLDRVGRRAYGPALVVVGLFGIGPTGAVPGANLAVSAIVLSLSACLLIGLPRPWIPGPVLELTVPARLLRRHAAEARQIGRRLGRLVRRRLDWLFGPAGIRIAALMCAALAAITAPLALIPFGPALPTSALILIGIAITAGDGLWMVAGLAWGGAALAGSAAMVMATPLL